MDDDAGAELDDCPDGDVSSDGDDTAEHTASPRSVGLLRSSVSSPNHGRSVAMMEATGPGSDLQDGPLREEFDAEQLLGAWDQSGPPNTDDFLLECADRPNGDVGAPGETAATQPGLLQDNGAGSSHDASAPLVPRDRTQTGAELAPAGSQGSQGQWVEQEAPLIPELATERRHLPWASTSDADFQAFFESCKAAAVSSLDIVTPTEANVGYSIKNTAARVIATAAEALPLASYHFQRMVAVCLVAAMLRLPDFTVREHVLIVWILEGGHRIRAHDGFCYIYHDDGAFQEYRHGVTPEATIGHLKDQLRTVEGIFRNCKKTMERDEQAILKEIGELLAGAGSESQLISSCHKECLEVGAIYGFKRKGSELEVVPAEEGAEQAPKRDDSWCRTTAGIVLRVSQTLMREITQDSFMQYIIHWCDRPRQSKMGVAYSDKAVLYTSDGAGPPLVTLVDSDSDTGLYVRVPHNLLDPVLQATVERLRRFYSQSFWTNFKVFQCIMAAQALAKRGLNVDRLFIGLSPGGVGQSLFTTHLHAIYGPGNHGYYDPNVWCLEEELRKQAENLASGCAIILTGQETPTSARGIKEDLYKRFITGEPVAARRPYGHETLMLRIVGWKRLEANRHLYFTGVTESNFNSILRRSFVYRINARFVEGSHLTDAMYRDHRLDGIYPSDPTLHRFVVSPPAVGAAIRMQHAFEALHSQADCLRLIDAYCNQGGDLGLTEQTMRIACGLPPREPPASGTESRPTSVALRQAVEGADVASQLPTTGVPTATAHKVIKYMLLHNKFSITPTSISSVRAGGWSDAELWRALTAKKLLFSGHLQGKGDNKLQFGCAHVPGCALRRRPGRERDAAVSRTVGDAGPREVRQLASAAGEQGRCRCHD